MNIRNNTNDMSMLSRIEQIRIELKQLNNEVDLQLNSINEDLEKFIEQCQLINRRENHYLE